MLRTTAEFAQVATPTDSSVCRPAATNSRCAGSQQFDAGDRIACRCLGITESEVRAAADFAGCRTLIDIKKTTEAGTGCMACHKRIIRLLNQTAGSTAHSPASSPS